MSQLTRKFRNYYSIERINQGYRADQEDQPDYELRPKWVPTWGDRGMIRFATLALAKEAIRKGKGERIVFHQAPQVVYQDKTRKA